MSHAIDGLRLYEEQLTRVLARVGTVDPASAAFQALLGECARSAAGLEFELQRLAQGSPAGRGATRLRVQRLVALNALVQDAVRRESESVAELIRQTRLVRECLGQVAQPLETGDSCDVRG